MGGYGKVRFDTTEFFTLMVLGSEFSTLTPYEKPNLGTLDYSEGQVKVRSKRSNFELDKYEQKRCLSDAVLSSGILWCHLFCFTSRTGKK